MARRKKGSGGDRTPANPAAVSGPGALSQRTDGPITTNPSNAEQARQPVRPIPGGTFGDRQGSIDQQSAAPMAAAPPTPALSPGVAVAGNGGPNLPFDPFINEGEPDIEDEMDEPMVMDDTDMYIGELFRLVRHPDLHRLLTMRSMRGGF